MSDNDMLEASAIRIPVLIKTSTNAKSRIVFHFSKLVDAVVALAAAQLSSFVVSLTAKVLGMIWCFLVSINKFLS